MIDKDLKAFASVAMDNWFEPQYLWEEEGDYHYYVWRHGNHTITITIENSEISYQKFKKDNSTYDPDQAIDLGKLKDHYEFGKLWDWLMEGHSPEYIKGLKVASSMMITNAELVWYNSDIKVKDVEKIIDTTESYLWCAREILSEVDENIPEHCQRIKKLQDEIKEERLMQGIKARANRGRTKTKTAPNPNFRDLWNFLTGKD